MTDAAADTVDTNRRHFLAIATAVTGVAGLGAFAVPFIASLQPSTRAKALGAPVEVPVGEMQSGEMVRVIWRGKVVYVLKRSDEMLARLPDNVPNLRDPDSTVADQQPAYAANATRSVREDFLVVEGVCTHLGCAPLSDFTVRPAEDWFGGFYCPCHGSKFDLAGRVFAGVPAQTNLVVPPYRFVRDDLILVGEDTGEA
jgi:ubiquinol-cytochrome c reductase iron-sulfur subunit